MPDGLLLIDKPRGLRSTDCVAQVKRFWGRGVRVGHAGTLDSTAEGLLIVLLGAATRLSDYVMKLPKVYEALIELGRATDTCDYAGDTVFCGDATRVDERTFDRVLCSFWGTRMQRPPEISALKVSGKPSHRLARSGKAPDLAVRPVDIFTLRRISPICGNRVSIVVRCGKGTYIRSIARDIGAALGCGAHIAALRRVSIGPFCVSRAASPGGLGDARTKALCTMRETGEAFHRILLDNISEKRLLNGLCVPLTEAGKYVPGYVPLDKGIYVEGENMIGFADVVSAEGDPCDEDGTERPSVRFLKPRTNIVCRGDVRN